MFYKSKAHFINAMNFKTNRLFGTVIDVDVLREVYAYNSRKPGLNTCSDMFFELDRCNSLSDIVDNYTSLIVTDPQNNLLVDNVFNFEPTDNYNSFDFKGNFGVYFLYDRNDNVIYIGKSTTNLKSRVATSFIDKTAHYCRLAFPKTIADTHVYELYYINMFKPKSNHADISKNDCLTIELPVLDLSEPLRIFDEW